MTVPTTRQHAHENAPYTKLLQHRKRPPPPPPDKGNDVSRALNKVRHPRGSCIVIPIAVSGVATPENKVTHWRCHP